MLKHKLSPVLYFSIGCCLLVLMILFFSCQKKEAVTMPAPQGLAGQHPFFHKEVGAPIPGETGRKWIANLQSKSRMVFPAFIVDSEEFTALISDTSCVGISLYYTQDETGQTHLALIGVNTAGYVMKKETVATEVGAVSWTQFQSWRKAYKAAHPGAVEAHFFGTNSFLRLIQQQQAEQVKAERALNDDGEPQLLLSDASLTVPGSYEDRSGPCPEYCPGDMDEIN